MLLKINEIRKKKLFEKFLKKMKNKILKINEIHKKSSLKSFKKNS